MIPHKATRDVARVRPVPHGVPHLTTRTRFRPCCPQMAQAEQIPTKLPHKGNLRKCEMAAYTEKIPYTYKLGGQKTDHSTHKIGESHG